MIAERMRKISVLTVLFLAACGGSEQAGPPAPEVTVATPERRDVQYFEELSGNTRAIEFAEVRARVPGTLDEQRFSASSVVREGQLLFVIEPEPYQASYDEAEAAVVHVLAQRGEFNGLRNLSSAKSIHFRLPDRSSGRSLFKASPAVVIAQPVNGCPLPPSSASR